jgi:hypothetical protein
MQKAGAGKGNQNEIEEKHSVPQMMRDMSASFLALWNAFPNAINFIWISWLESLHRISNFQHYRLKSLAKKKV